ncbi:MAG: tetratricopeptide repeat protein [Desulfobacteraceae bacterium]|jgi:tetratricopeptide (TPR) repeat protein
MEKDRKQQILNRAKSDPEFFDKVKRLGAIADRIIYQDTYIWMHIAPYFLDFAQDAGLYEDIPKPTQESINELLDWLLHNASMIAYIAKKEDKLAHGKRFKKPVGKVFLSWSVSSPRDREAMVGIKRALDYFNVDYFDYTQYQFDDLHDHSEEIKRMLTDEVKNAKLSIEIRSGDFGNTKWIEYEKYLISKNSRLFRIFICLDAGIATLLSQDPSQEKRTLRLDMSDGRLLGSQTSEFDCWMAQGIDKTYYNSPQYMNKCFDLAWTVRKQLDPWESFRSFIEFPKYTDRIAFHAITSRIYLSGQNQPLRHPHKVTSDKKGRLSINRAEKEYQKGLYLGSSGQHKLAIKAFKRAITADPNHSDAYFNLGYAYGAVGNNEEEIRAYQDAIRANPRHFYAHDNLASTYVQSADYENAINHFKRAIKLEPKFINAHLNLGAVYAECQDWQNAIELFERAVHIDPLHPPSLYNLGIAYHKVGNNDAANKQLKVLKKLHPQRASALLKILQKKMSVA